ncbi:MAG TPA: DinB family protein [Gemmatimonadaceae bacterium]|nr:DinB family protein [Gemmatimonadaceae bacterium]
MKRSLAIIAAAGLLIAAVPHHEQAPASAIATDRMIWSQTIGFVTAAAEQVPESLYAFRPAPTVRTFGQLVAHIAGSQNMFCGAALGEKPSAEDDVEKNATTKAAIIAALKASTAHCEKAYALSDAAALNQKVSLFGMNATGMWAILLNTSHDDEHYGNMVTYMRIKGMVPPSSAPMPASK